MRRCGRLGAIVVAAATALTFAPRRWTRCAPRPPTASWWINVGDAGYDPLYPYGWGLRTR
jgi:hypothetical protein